MYVDLPLVSVIIPTYNYGNYISEAINSVKRQTYPYSSIEIIVVDDGSIDNTSYIMKQFESDNAIQYYYQENNGKASATKLAIELCKGKYIFNLDADDYFLPDKIEYYINIFESDIEIVHIGSPATVIYDDNSDSSIENIPTKITGVSVEGHELLDIFYNNNILYGGGTTYAARAITLKSIEIPPSVDMLIDEFLLLALLPLGKSYIFKKSYSVWRIHSSNFSRKTSFENNKVDKGIRLLRSSESILDYLKSNSFKDNLIKIYTLKNLIKEISYKESLGIKNIGDIFIYFLNVVKVVGFNLSWFLKYDVLKKMFPTSLIWLLRKVKYTMRSVF